MALEIERKFLITSEEYKTITQPLPYVQGYIVITEEKIVRIRTVGNKGFITVKLRVNDITRKEYEYEIPYTDAVEMLEETSLLGKVEKYRYRIEHQGFLWEVDEFIGSNQGLVIAEIELTSEDQMFNKPSWIGEEVTQDPRYLNARLALKPYTEW